MDSSAMGVMQFCVVLSSHWETRREGGGGVGRDEEGRNRKGRLAQSRCEDARRTLAHCVAFCDHSPPDATRFWWMEE